MKDIIRQLEKSRDQDLDWKGRQSAFSTIARSFQDMAYAHALSRLGDIHLAQDAAQSSLILAWTNLDSLRDLARFPGWLRQIVTNECAAILRKRQDYIVDTYAVANCHADATRQFVNSEITTDIRKAVQELKETERICVSLFYVSDYSQNDISEYLDLPVSTIKKRLHTARGHLREKLIHMIEDEIREDRPSKNETLVDYVALFSAIKDRNLEAVVECIEKSPGLLNRKGTDPYGIVAESPLDAAIRADSAEIVRFLLNKGVVPMQQNVQAAASTGKRNVAALLVAGGGIERLVAACPANIAQFFRTVHSGDIDGVADAVQNTPPLTSAVDADGRTALHIASMYGYSDIVSKLVDAGADIYRLDANSRTALQLAVMQSNWCNTGQREVLELLGNAGSPYTIHDAASAGSLQLVKALLERDPLLLNTVNEREQTPLESAVVGFSSGASEVIQYLLEKDPEMNIWMASQFGRLDRLRGLLRIDPLLANMPRDGNRGNRPLHSAAQNWCPPDNTVPVIYALVEHGADVNATAGPSEWTPLHACAEWWNDTQIAEALISCGANVNALSATEWTPLKYAKELGRTEMMHFLFEKGGTD